MSKKFHKGRSRGTYKESGKNNEPIWVYGFHAVQACFDMQAENIVEILLARDSHEYQTLVNDMQRLHLPIQRVDNEYMNKMLGPVRHQSIAVRLKESRVYTENDLFDIVEDKQDKQKSILLLVLDGITDPRNLGACMRSANGAGVDAVIVPKDNASGITAVTRKTASGAAEMTPFVQVTNLSRTLRDLQSRNIWIVGTSDGAEESVYQQDFNKDIAMVLGSEDKGIRALTAKTCDQLVSIPMLGSVNSLNVSVATAVCLYEVLRQKLV